MELAPLQQKFVNNLLKGMDQKNAYIKAGYKARGNSAESKASRLVRNGKVKAVYDKLRARAEKKAEVSRTRILEEYAKVAFLDPRRFFDKHDNLIPIHKLDKNVSAALGRMDVFQRKTKNGEIITTKKIKFLDKKSALDSLARHLGMFKDKVNVGVEAEVISAILAGLPEELRRDVIESINRHLSTKLT
jgi:phage terminase small subunit